MCLSDGMVDVPDSKSGGGDTVWVQVPPQAPFFEIISILEIELIFLLYFKYVDIVLNSV